MEAKRQIRTTDEVLKEFFQGKIGRNKLYQMVRENSIPHMRINRKILFDLQDLNNWWAEQTTQPQQEVSSSNIHRLY